MIADKYRLEGPLARGGMGAIWTARHVTLGSQVAVKFLDARLSGSPAFVSRFEREARAAASIQSPHVVMVHDFGVDNGTPYLAMELLHGEDLRVRIKKMGYLSLSTSAGILMQAGKGLRRAHEAGIIHRDIKPGNLFLAKQDDDEIVKVLDFGIAKETDRVLDEHTNTGELVGSPHYVSPEQARGQRDLDHRSDVWSLGVIAYRMVTGQLPFPGEALGDVLAKVLVDPPPKVGCFGGGLPRSLDDFFAKALAKKRDDRFGSVRELVDAFVAIVNEADEEDSLSPPSWSTIVTVSQPDGGPPEIVLVRGMAGLAKKPSAPAEPCAMDVPFVEPSTKFPGAEAPAASIAAEITPPSSRSGKRDSLMPAMGPHVEPLYPHPVLRFRWAVAAAVSLSVAVTFAVSWSRSHGVAPGASATSDTSLSTGVSVIGAPSPGMPPPAAAPRSAAPSSSALPPPLTGLAPSSGLPTSSASTSMMTGNNGGSVSTAQPVRSASASASPAQAPSGTRRKWGF